MLFHEAPLISPWQSSVPVSASRLRRVVALRNWPPLNPVACFLIQSVRSVYASLSNSLRAASASWNAAFSRSLRSLLASRSAISSGDICGKHNTVRSENRITGSPYGFFSRHCPYHCLNSSGSPLHVL